MSWISFDKRLKNNKDTIVFTGRDTYSKDDEGFDLHLGNGSRSAFHDHETPVKRLAGPPAGIVLLNGFSVKSDDGEDLRINVEPSELWENSFSMLLGTWSGTHIYSGVSTYIMIGNMPVTKKRKLENKNLVRPTKKAKPSTEDETQDIPIEKECRICFDAVIDTVIIPCGHICVCLTCSRTLTGEDGKDYCPICNTLIENVYKTFAT
eukprot:TRINITY_DN3014_c0_g1_i2.p1 TRINITY_DN3014_c0_g1~~TRINITY_DN3014_c0_g1_i2.p1  ORF type:complete len:207 (+),score=30.37 TRINITY_DN3014_c0_g1_i2:875-1495(+)